MKVGLSLSQCVADIMNDVVSEAEVLVIITRTDFDPYNDAHWTNVLHGYIGNPGFNSSIWQDFIDQEYDLRELVQRLYDHGKIHQPRQFGSHPRASKFPWYEVFIPETELQDKPAVKKAWNKYKLIAGLS